MERVSLVQATADPTFQPWLTIFGATPRPLRVSNVTSQQTNAILPHVNRKKESVNQRLLPTTTKPTVLECMIQDFTSGVDPAIVFAAMVLHPLPVHLLVQTRVKIVTKDIIKTVSLVKVVQLDSTRIPMRLSAINAHRTHVLAQTALQPQVVHHSIKSNVPVVIQVTRWDLPRRACPSPRTPVQQTFAGAITEHRNRCAFNTNV